MTLNEVIDLIQTWIVENGNEEITADVLRPILEAMVNQPNDLIGDLDNLTTTDKDNLVEAINEVRSLAITNAGLVIHSGSGTPTETPPVSVGVGDFYAQVIFPSTSVTSFWQYNGSVWVEQRPQRTRTVLKFVSLIGVTVTGKSQVQWMAEAINLNIANGAVYECEPGDIIDFYVNLLEDPNNDTPLLKRVFTRLITGETSVTSVDENDLMPDGSEDVPIDSELIIELGDIGTDNVWDAFNTDPSQPFAMDNEMFVSAIQNSENKLWQWIGGTGLFGSTETPAVESDFLDLTEQPPITTYQLFRKYDDIAAMLADQSTQIAQQGILVLDATDDPNITFPSGLDAELKYAYYQKIGGSTTGTISDYRLISAPWREYDLSSEDLQAVSERGNVTDRPLGIAASAIDANVELLKIGDGVPSDQKNLVTITKTHSENPTGSTNGLNIEITAVATATGAGRIARALKGVGKPDPNGFNLTNTAGGGLGVEGAVIAIGENGGIITMATGGYFRIANRSDNVTIENAVSVYANNPTLGGGPGTGIFVRAIGLLSTNQNQFISISNTAEILIGQEGLVDFTGNWAILSKSLYPSQFEKTIKVKEAPTADEDVVRLVDVIGGAGELPFTNPAADGIEKRKIQGADVGVSGSGQQVPRWNTVTEEWTSVQISTSSGPASIALRGAGGRLKVGDAVDADDAVTKAQLDALTGGRTAVAMDIGDWDMTDTFSRLVAHGLSAAEWKTIKFESFWIRDDADAAYYHSSPLIEILVDSTNIELNRIAADKFDSTDFDATGYNRGKIFFSYISDS